MFIIKSTWDTVNRFWDGGMWKPSEDRARRFPTRADAEKCLKTMTWITDISEQNMKKRVKPVTDVEIVEVTV